MKHIKTLKIDIDKKNFEVIPSVQYDSNTRFLHIQLLNNSVPCDITGCSVILSGVKEDGTSIFNSCDVINPEIAFIQAEITEQMNVIPGLIDCEIKIYDGEGVLTSKKFTIKVTASQTSRLVVSSNEFKALTDALNKVQAIDNKAEKAEVKKLSSQLDTIESKKATKVEVDLERKRIDNLINISSGEVDNVEISDARIGANGIVYDNLGNTIRLQLNEKIDGDIPNSKYYWEAGAYNVSGDKIGYANETHSRTKTYLPTRLKAIINNGTKTINIIVYESNGTFSSLVNLTTGKTYNLEDNKLYNLNISQPFADINTIVNNIVFVTKPNKYETMINNQKHILKSEIGFKVAAEEKSYPNVSVKPDGTTMTFKGWYTGDYKICSGFKYIICEDVAFYTNIPLNAISFYDVDKNYIGGLNVNNVTGTASGVGYIKLTGKFKIPNNAYYFRDGKYNYNGNESNNIISLCANEIPLDEIGNEIASIYDKISNISTNEKINLKGLLCIGDSLTQGDYGSNPPGTMNIKSENYPYYLSKYLNKFVEVGVTNAGKCGYNATGYWEKMIKTISMGNTRTIVIMLGTNGYLTDTIEADTTITSGQTYENYSNTHTGNYCKIIEYCLEQTNNLAQIFLVTPPKNSQRVEASMLTTVEVIKKIGEKYSLPVIDGYNGFGISPTNFSTMLPIDGLHGSKLAYKKIATYIGSNILSNLSYVIED